MGAEDSRVGGVQRAVRSEQEGAMWAGLRTLRKMEALLESEGPRAVPPLLATRLAFPLRLCHGRPLQPHSPSCSPRPSGSWWACSGRVPACAPLTRQEGEKG